MSALHCPACGAPQPQEGPGPVAPGASGRQCHHCDGPLVALGAPDPRFAMPCRGCGQMVADGSTFCPYCGSAMADRASSGVGRRCPGCNAETLTEHGLAPTHVYREGWAVSGCNTCGGVWVDARTLEAIVERASHRSSANVGPVVKSQVSLAADQVRYRGCPTCSQLMARRNFARISGVIVDQCKPHGTWFDAGELDAIVRFVESGGLAAAHARETRELEADRRRANAPISPHHVGGPGVDWDSPYSEYSLVEAFLGFVLRRRRRWRW